MLTETAAAELGRGPAAEIERRLDAATTEAELVELRLAVCSHPAAGQLAARFAARREQLRYPALTAARPSGIPEAGR